jgi:O-antigen/teichoic acid export membrane protein
MLISLLGRVLQFIIAFASVRIMTQLLSPTQMGIFALVTTATSLFALFFINPVGMFFNRRLHAWINGGHVKRRFCLYVIYIFGVSCLAAFLINIFYAFGIFIEGVSLFWLVTLVCGSLLFNTIVQTLVPSLNMVDRHGAFAILNLGVLLLGLLISVLLSVFIRPAAEMWLLGTLISQIICSAVAYRIFFGRIVTNSSTNSLINTDQLRQVTKFCWPIAIAVLLQWLHMQGYRFFLADSFGIAQLGLYSAGYGIASSLMSAAETIFTTWFQPQFYKDVNAICSSQQNRAWVRYAEVMIPASLLCLSALIAASPALPRLMLGSAFHNVGQFIVLGALAEWTRVMVGIVSLNAHRHMATKLLIIPNAIGAVGAYIVLFALLNNFGIVAAPVAIFAGGVAVFCYMYKITYAGDVDAKLEMSKFALMAFVLLVSTVLFLWLQSSIVSQLDFFVSLLVCFGIGAVWATVGWHFLKPVLIDKVQLT